MFTHVLSYTYTVLEAKAEGFIQPVKDPWHDANLVPVFEFLYSDESTQIPSNWVPTMEAFRKELLATVELSNPELVDEYNYINSSR